MAALRPLDGGGIKTSRASLIGGIAVGIGVFVLWTLLARDLGGDGLLTDTIGLVLSGLIGLWIWRADL
ncbi:hypothetical protein [Roseicella aquatilis]|uniref:Uncharacterized protein n=1 Tax=Roseicella aquatilis TaxID=2527868 RepID=A0A4R4DSS8_9PROT|nr:hypothetical protein [Roseicella aquatilis]TCZ64435.1 hypothetical protein EXY23_07250 [Roseicella aquatilis]